MTDTMVLVLVVGATLTAAFWYFGGKLCNWLDEREKAKQQRKHEEFDRALNLRPQAVAAYLMLKPEIEAVLRQLGRKDVSLVFTA